MADEWGSSGDGLCHHRLLKESLRLQILGDRYCGDKASAKGTRKDVYVQHY